MTYTALAFFATMILAADTELAPNRVVRQPSQGYQSVPFSNAHSLHYGIAHPKLSGTLRFLISGTIAKIHVTEGQVVREGDPLVVLDDRLAQVRLRLAQLSASRTGELRHAAVHVALAEKQLSRLEHLYTQNAVSEAEIEEQRAVVDRAKAIHATQMEAQQLAEANREYAEEQLRHMTIFAPFDGVVIERHQKLGASVTIDAAILSVANLKTLQVELHTPIHLYGTINRGDMVTLSAREPINDTIQATVTSVSPIINAASGTFRCNLEINNSAGRLPAGFAVSLSPHHAPVAGDSVE